MDANNKEKSYYLTPEEGRALCEKARKAVEYCMDKFPEVDEANQRLENSRFYKWVKARNAQLDENSNDKN